MSTTPNICEDEPFFIDPEALTTMARHLYETLEYMHPGSVIAEQMRHIYLALGGVLASKQHAAHSATNADGWDELIPLDTK